MAKKWFDIRNQSAKNVADIEIYSEIGTWGVSAQDFNRELLALGEDIDEINLSIHSSGGSVFDGLFIYNKLVSHPASVNVEILGLAASAASFIAMAGDTIVMPRTAEMMIHNAWSVAVGNAEEMEEEARFLRKIDSTIVNIYAERTGLEEDRVREMMAEEYWMNGDEALELGFITSTNDHKAAAASPDFLKHFKTQPKQATKKAVNTKDIKTVRDFEKRLRDLGVSKKEATALASVKLDLASDSQASNGNDDLETKPLEASLNALSNILKQA